MRFGRLLGEHGSVSTPAVCAALGDPTRWAITELLSTGPMTVNDIAGHFDLSRTAVSRHLSALRASGLVTASKDAQRSVHRLDPKVLDQLGGVLGSLAGSGGTLPLTPAARHRLSSADPDLVTRAVSSARARGSALVTASDLVAAGAPDVPGPEPTDDVLDLADQVAELVIQLRDALRTDLETR